MPLTPLTDGMSGLDCRTNINASFTQVDANVTAIATKLPLAGGALTAAVSVPTAANHLIASARANGFMIGASLAVANEGISGFNNTLFTYTGGGLVSQINSAGLQLDSSVWLSWGSGAASSSQHTFISGSLDAATLQIGKDSATPIDQTLKGPNGVGKDIVGGDLSISAGQSTGNASPGLLRLKGTAPGSTGATEQTYSDHLLVGGELVEVETGIAFQLGNEAVSETPSATHTLIVKDSSGTSYRLLCTPI